MGTLDPGMALPLSATGTAADNVITTQEVRSCSVESPAVMLPDSRPPSATCGDATTLAGAADSSR
jgi:hypothetical protein